MSRTGSPGQRNPQPTWARADDLLFTRQRVAPPQPARAGRHQAAPRTAPPARVVVSAGMARRDLRLSHPGPRGNGWGPILGVVRTPAPACAATGQVRPASSPTPALAHAVAGGRGQDKARGRGSGGRQNSTAFGDLGAHTGPRGSGSWTRATRSTGPRPGSPVAALSLQAARAYRRPPGPGYSPPGGTVSGSDPGQCLRTVRPYGRTASRHRVRATPTRTVRPCGPGPASGPHPREHPLTGVARYRGATPTPACDERGRGTSDQDTL